MANNGEHDRLSYDHLIPRLDDPETEENYRDGIRFAEELTLGAALAGVCVGCYNVGAPACGIYDLCDTVAQ